jgi:hypothetical protein
MSRNGKSFERRQNMHKDCVIVHATSERSQQQNKLACSVFGINAVLKRGILRGLNNISSDVTWYDDS